MRRLIASLMILIGTAMAAYTAIALYAHVIVIWMLDFLTGISSSRLGVSGQTLTSLDGITALALALAGIALIWGGLRLWRRPDRQIPAQVENRGTGPGVRR